MTRGALRAAWALFALAGLTGALYRFVVAYGVSTGLDPVNIRHAHSHLMYFGWVTPALFVLVGAWAASRGAKSPSPRLLVVTLGLALVTGAAFLPWGYRPAVVGNAQVPVTIILSTLCMAAWYAWLAWYRRARGAIVAEQARPLVDVAAVFLALSTLGAWSVAAMVPFGGAGATLKLAFAHLFLQYFSEGWFALGLLAVAWSRLPETVRVPRWALALVVFGVAAGFLLSLPSGSLGGPLRLAARSAGIAHGSGLLVLGWTWWRAAPASVRSTWGLPMLVLATKGATQALALVVPGPWWADLVAVRVLYLHLLLLGFVTAGIAAESMRGAWLTTVQITVVVVVVSLVPFTQLWPFAPPGVGALRAAAWIALAPAGVAIAALMVDRIGLPPGRR